MGSLSAALGLSEMSIHSVFLIVTENVESLKVILEANYSALHLHSQHFSFFFFSPPFTSIPGPPAFQLCAPH